MATNDWRRIVASALDWEQAHATFDSAVADLAPKLRGTRPDKFPHSAWELVEHIRRTQHDLLEFCTNEQYEELKWPDDYWPPQPAPDTDAAWNASIAAYHRDAAALAAFTLDESRDLTAKI